MPRSRRKDNKFYEFNDFSEMDVIMLTLDYLKVKKYLTRGSIITLAVKQKYPNIRHINMVEISPRFRKLCSDVLRKMKLCGVIEPYNNRTLKRSAMLDKITPKQIITTSVVSNKKKRSD